MQGAHALQESRTRLNMDLTLVWIRSTELKQSQHDCDVQKIDRHTCFTPSHRRLEIYTRLPS
jgi:hypothetical protein